MVFVLAYMGVDGLRLCGPFEEHDDAVEYTRRFDGPYIIMPVTRVRSDFKRLPVKKVV